MPESEGLLVVGESDFIADVTIKEFPDSGRLMTWRLVKPYGTQNAQTFWTGWENRSLLHLPLDEIEGQVVRAVQIVPGGITIKLSNGLAIDIPLMF